jgi:two-component system KDP operon response regulator KdpE
MKKPHILIIDDEPQILRALYTILTANHYQVTSANRGEVGLALAALEKPDVIILDLGLPDMDGLTVCGQLREWTQTPIIILSVRDADRDKVQVLDKGADDYLVKPFSSDELLARIRVALRHTLQAQVSSTPVVQTAQVSIDLSRRMVTKSENEVKLTAKEFARARMGTGVYQSGGVSTRVYEPTEEEIGR